MLRDLQQAIFERFSGRKQQARKRGLRKEGQFMPFRPIPFWPTPFRPMPFMPFVPMGTIIQPIAAQNSLPMQQFFMTPFGVPLPSSLLQNPQFALSYLQFLQNHYLDMEDYKRRQDGLLEELRSSKPHIEKLDELKTKIVEPIFRGRAFYGKASKRPDYAYLIRKREDDSGGDPFSGNTVE